MSDSDPVDIREDVPFTHEEKMQLVAFGESPFWPLLRLALRRYQAKALLVIEDHNATIDEIRMAQGRRYMARQLTDLVEHDAPAYYEKVQREADNEPDDDL